MIEINCWNIVPDYESYEVSTLGQLRRVGRPHSYIFGALDKDGYIRALVYNNAGRKSRGVHRLVMSAFYGKSDKMVNHINGIKTDNRLVNLEYVTHKENGAHAARMNLAAYGERMKINKLKEADVREIKRRLQSGLYTQQQIADAFGVCQVNISAIKLGQTWKRVVV